MLCSVPGVGGPASAPLTQQAIHDQEPKTRCAAAPNVSASRVCFVEGFHRQQINIVCYPAGLDRARASTRFVVNAVSANVDTSKSPKSQGFTMPGVCSRLLRMIELSVALLSICYQ